MTSLHVFIYQDITVELYSMLKVGKISLQRNYAKPFEERFYDNKITGDK